VDIHIDVRWREGDEKDDDRELMAGEDMPIGLQNGLINHPVFDKALVDIEIDPLCIPFRKRWKAGKP
jgi:hypothetical protein